MRGTDNRPQRRSDIRYVHLGPILAPVGEAGRTLGRRQFVSGAALLTATGCVADPIDPQPTGTAPVNVLILKSDEHNPFITSVMGHPFIRTPNLDRLARQGTVYESCYCPSPLCSPSRSSWLSGLPAHETHIYDNSKVLPFPDYQTYGGVLDKQGVDSVFLGKVDGWKPPEEMGFTEMRGRIFRDPHRDFEVGKNAAYLRRGLPVPILPAAGRAKGVGEVDSVQDAFGVAVTDIERGVHFLHSVSRDLHRPWVLEVDLMPPHFPHYVPDHLWEMYKCHEDLPKYGREQPTANHPYSRDLRRYFETRSMLPVTGKHRRAYYGRVTWVDRQLGRLMDALDASGQAARTVVAYTSDHGEMLGKFGMWWKRSMLEDSARVPLVVAGPGFARGKRASTPVTQWDLQAAIFEASGASRPEHWLGEPLQRLPLHSATRAAFSEFHGTGVRGSSFLVRRGRWKLIWNAGAPHQLFDLGSDPDELHNLAAHEPKHVNELIAVLRDQFADPDRENDRANRYVDAEIRQLHAWGVRVK